MAESTTPAQQISYRTTRDLPRDGVLVLYGACRWSSAEKPDELMAALAGSHSVISAWDGDRLVGLGNAITDGALVVYYPHLLVHPDYQRRGIGREIMRQLMEKYAGYHQHSVLADQRAAGFYRSTGFTEPTGIRPMWIYSGSDHGPPDALSFWRNLMNWSDLSPRQRSALYCALGLLAAIVVAAISLAHTPTVLLTWPILALIGFAFCAITWPLQSRATFACGLSAPLMTALAAFLLVFLDWANGRSIVTRHDVVEVLSGTLMWYGILLLPLFVVAIRRVLQWQGDIQEPRKTKWQFSLRTLLVLMTVVAICAPLLGGAANSVNDKTGLWVFGWYALVVFAACGVAIERFLAFQASK